MKIAMFAPSWPPGSVPNGIVTYLGHIVPAIQNLGHEVFILTLNPLGQKDNPHVVDLNEFGSPISIFGRKPGGLPQLTRAVMSLVVERKIDILEMEESFGWSHAISELDILPVVVRLHGPWFLNKYYEDKNREKREGKAIAAATVVTSPSRSVLESTIERYNISRRPTTLIYNSLDVTEAQWKLEKCDVDSILFVGRFDKIKGGDIVLRSFADLSKRNPRLRLTIVGPDIGVAGLKFIDFARSVFSEDALDRVDFLGPLDRKAIDKLRVEHFMTISASRYEVFGYTVLEAMALGCPIVAPNVGGIPELIKSRSNGLLYSAGSPDALSASCQTLLDNRELAKRYGAAGRRSCIDGFDSRSAARQTIKSYRQAIELFRSKQSLSS
jgi:glycosyltransferase involved in cell wall biosynthesis